MPKISESFDPQFVEWRRVTDPDCTEFKIDFEYSLLGYDLTSGRLDMLLRYAEGRGHCRRHRHVASTLTLVLEGEQHLLEMQRDGTTKAISRKKGDYALASPDALPHTECGGDAGGTGLVIDDGTRRYSLRVFGREHGERVDTLDRAVRRRLEQRHALWNGSQTGRSNGLKPVLPPPHLSGLIS